MMFRTNSTRRLLAAALVAAAGSVGLVTAPASAGVTSATVTGDAATSKKHLANFAGTASYDSAAGMLTITVKNMSTRGYLTGLGFNAKGAATAAYHDGDAAGTKIDEDAYDQLRMKHGVAKLKPFAAYEAGSALDGKWNPGHSRRGVAAGATHTFTFNVAGASAGDTVVDLLGSDSLALVAQFKGLKGGRKDQMGAKLQLIPAVAPADTTPPTDITDGGSTTTPGGNTGGHVTDPDGGALPPVVIPGGTGGNNGGGNTHAVPLPPAAWSGLGTMGLAVVAALRRRSFGAA